MNRTRSEPCPVCGETATKRRGYEFNDDKWRWMHTRVSCVACNYVFESNLFDSIIVEGVAHVVLERESYAADDRDPERVIDRVIRQHIRRLAVLKEGAELVRTREFKKYMTAFSFANANKDHVRKRHLDFLRANKTRFPLNYKAFASFVKELSKFRESS